MFYNAVYMMFSFRERQNTMRSDSKTGRGRKPVPGSLSGREKKERQRQQYLRFERKLFLVSAAVLAAALLAGGFFSLCSSSFFYTRAAAVTAGSHKITPVLYDYFYEDTYNSFCSTYGDYLSYLFDASKPLDKQLYDEDTKTTWADHFRELTLQAIRQTYALYDEANAHGFRISADTQKQIDDAVYYIGLYANYYKFDSSDDYLVSRYGKGASTDSYRTYAVVTKTADAYGEQYKSALSFTDGELEQYYADNRKLFDTVDYRCFPVSVKAGGAVDPAASRTLAQSIADESAGDEDRFCALVLENADDPDYYTEADRTIRNDFSYSNAPESLADWLFDADRRPGDTTVADNGDNGCFVAFWLSRNTHDYQMVDVRAIPVAVSDFSNGTAVRLAKKSAQQLLDAYRAGDRTEDAFAALAAQNGAADGGLKENVYRGQLDDALDSWCYDSARRPGDTALLQGSDGFYVLYFVGPGDNCRLDTVREALQQNDYQDWYDALAAASSFRTHWFGMKFAASQPIKTGSSAASSSAS